MRSCRLPLVRSLRRSLTLLLVCGVAVAQAVFFTPMATATAAQPSGSALAGTQADGVGSVAYVRDLDSPAVVRIVNVVFAQVIFTASDGTQYVFPYSNSSAAVQLQGNTYAYGEGFSGSGAFISSDGYILTADHVVDQNCNSDVNQPSVVQNWEDDLQQNWQVYGFNSANDATTFGQDALNNKQVSIQCQSGGYTKVFPSLAYQGQLNSSGALVGWNVTQVVQSSPFDQQDVAIIKVQPPHDMPYLTLATADQVQTGETITAIAYPGDADQPYTSFVHLLNPANDDVNDIMNLITPSIDTGQITTQQHDSNGTLDYETSGIAYHGSSGGPAIDSQGRIVGFFDYTTDSQNNRITVLIASSVAATYAGQAGVGTPRPGTVEPAWTKSINDFYASGPCHFGNAASDLQQLKNLHPEFAGVQSFYLTAEQKQTPQACAASKQTGPSGGVIALIAILLLAILGGGGYFLLRRRTPRELVPAAVGVGPLGSMTMSQDAHQLSSGGPASGPITGSPTTGGPTSGPITGSATPTYVMADSTPTPTPTATPTQTPTQTPTVMPTPTPAPRMDYPSIPETATTIAMSDYPSAPHPPATPAGDGHVAALDTAATRTVDEHPSLPDAVPTIDAFVDPNGTVRALPSERSSTVPLPDQPPRPEPPVPSMAMYTPLVHQARTCVNGHSVEDSHARFCPECGASVPPNVGAV